LKKTAVNSILPLNYSHLFIKPEKIKMPNIKTEFGKINFEVSGSGNSNAIIMIHDNGHSSKFFDPELRFYSSYFKVITPDLLNHGKSAEYKGENFWQDNASAILLICEKLKVRKVSLLGVGCGAYVALNSMINNPGLIHKAIIDSFPGEELSENYMERIIKHRDNVKNTSLKQHYSGMNGSKWENILQWNSEMQMSFVNRGLPLLAGKLEDIKTPVLMTASAADEIISDAERIIRNFSAKIKKSYVHIFQNGAHPSFIKKSDEFRSLSLRFLLD
jgi:pimeloyl-ACP methyl ester carboxylesterase